jgi:glucokinase
MTIAVGIDIGGTNTKIGLVDQHGETLEYISFPTESDKSIDSFINNIDFSVKKLMSNHNISPSQILGVGVGCPNADARSGMLVSPPNLGWGSINLKEHLEKIFDVPVYLGNDANVAAYGENKWGAAQGMDDFIVVTLGTGIGTGIFVNGQLLLGSNGIAGEGGHLIIEPNGRPCHCGGKGHLECYGSVRGIKETVKDLTGEDLLFRDIAERFKDGDSQMKEAFRRTAEYLAIGLADMTALFSPSSFILAGGIATIGEDFCSDVKKYLDEFVFPPFKGQTEVTLSKIATEHGAVMGAASLVFYHH